MSVQAMSWVLDHSEATLGTRLVALSIANHAGPKGSNAWAGISTIAAEAHVSRQAVLDALERLVALGEVIVWKNGGPTVRGGRLNRYEMPKVPGWERPEGMPDQPRTAPNQSGPESVPVAPAEVVKLSDESGQVEAPKVVKLGPTAPHIEPRTNQERTTPPTPPQAGGGKGNVEPRFKGMTPDSVADTPTSLAILGANTPGWPRLEAVKHAGGWSRLEDVPSHDEAVIAFTATVATSSSDRAEIRKRVRDSREMGESPGDFLLALATTNVYSQPAMNLVRGVNSRDAAGIDRVGLGTGSRKQSAASRGTEAFLKQREKRKARNVIDADSEEVFPNALEP